MYTTANTLTVNAGTCGIALPANGCDTTTTTATINGSALTGTITTTGTILDCIGYSEKGSALPVWHGDGGGGAVWEPTDFVRKIIFNDNATIVFWADDTKTVVKWDGSGEWSEYTAFCAALAIKLFGSNSHLKRVIKDNAEYHGKRKQE